MTDHRRGMFVITTLALSLLSLAATTLDGQRAPATARTPWAAVDAAMGRPGALNPGNVNKYSFPRSDLHVTAGGVQLRPALALGSWLAFTHVGGGHAMMMGDLVLTEDEVPPVMLALQQGGVEQTALHNHMLGEEPRLFFMHFWANDDAATLAAGLRAALDRMAIKRA